MNIYGTSSIFPGCGIDGQNVAPQPGTAALRLDPATSKLQLSNNGAPFLDVGSGNSGKSVVAGNNISVTSDISGNWVTSTVPNPSFSAVTVTSGMVNSIDLPALASTVSSTISSDNPVKATSTPTFVGLTLSAPLVTSSTVDGVDVSTFKSSYDARIDQPVKVTSSPTFAALTTTDQKINGVNVVAVEGVINTTLEVTNPVKTTSSPTFVGLTLSAPLVTSSTVDGVDVSSFKSAYDANVNQPVTTTSSPSFAAVNIGADAGVGSIIQSGTELQLIGNTTCTGMRMTYGPTLNRRSVLINEIDGLYAHKLGTPVLSTALVGTGAVTSAGDLTISAWNTEKIKATSSGVLLYDDTLIKPDIDSEVALGVTSAANRSVFTVSSSSGAMVINGPAASISEFIATKILSSASSTTSTILGASETFQNAFKTSYTSIGAGLAGSYLSFMGYGSYTPAMTLDMNGVTQFTSQVDLSTQTMKYQYSQDSPLHYRLVSARLNSGNGPSGRNRMEWYGINGRKGTGSNPGNYDKTYGFTFQQQPSFGGGYYDVLDIDYDAVTVNSSTPLRVDYHEPSSASHEIIFRGRSAAPGQATDFSFYNNTISSTGLKISCSGTSTPGQVTLRGASSTNTIGMQCFVAGVAKDALVFGSNGLLAEYLAIGELSAASPMTGSLRRVGGVPQWYTGTSWAPIQLYGGIISTNSINCLPSSAMYIRGPEHTAGVAQSYYISNNQIDTTALHIRPDGVTDTIAIRSLSGTGVIHHQAYISGTPTNVATINTSGLTVDYLRVSSNGQAAAGGLRYNGSLEYHNGTSWVSSAPSAVSVVRIANSVEGLTLTVTGTAGVTAAYNALSGDVVLEIPTSLPNYAPISVFGAIQERAYSNTNGPLDIKIHRPPFQPARTYFISAQASGVELAWSDITVDSWIDVKVVFTNALIE